VEYTAKGEPSRSQILRYFRPVGIGPPNQAGGIDDAAVAQEFAQVVLNREIGRMIRRPQVDEQHANTFGRRRSVRVRHGAIISHSSDP
jgi:hypothetical protein